MKTGEAVGLIVGGLLVAGLAAVVASVLPPGKRATLARTLAARGAQQLAHVKRTRRRLVLDVGDGEPIDLGPFAFAQRRANA